MIRLTRAPHDLGYGWDRAGIPGQDTMRYRVSQLTATDFADKDLDTLQKEVLEGLAFEPPAMPKFDWQNAMILVPVDGQVEDLIADQLTNALPDNWDAEPLALKICDRQPTEFLLVPCTEDSPQLADIRKVLQPTVDFGEGLRTQLLAAHLKETGEALVARQKQVAGK